MFLSHAVSDIVLPHVKKPLNLYIHMVEIYWLLQEMYSFVGGLKLNVRVNK